MSIGMITKIGVITDGPVPQMGPISTRALLIEVWSTGALAPAVLEISQDAARELAAELVRHLQGRGFR